MGDVEGWNVAAASAFAVAVLDLNTVQRRSVICEMCGLGLIPTCPYWSLSTPPSTPRCWTVLAARTDTCVIIG
jgi:hypothetical protein